MNVLTHTKAGDLNKKNVAKQKHGDQHEALDNPMEAGALWDIFQRREVPKLEEYLRNCSAEFTHYNCLSEGQVVLYYC